MVEPKVLEALRQASPNEIGEIFRDCMLGIVRESFARLLLAEVAELCGPFYRPSPDSEFKRAGSAPGYVRLGGRKIPVKRPRVARRRGGERELLAYSARKKGDEVYELICEALAAGVSAGEARRVYPDSGCASSSSASRAWVAKGLEMLDHLRGRELSGEEFFRLTLDGVVLSDDLTALVALGITRDGCKMMLDFEISSKESVEVRDALLDRLARRGLKDPKGHRLVVVLDGSAPLRKSVLRRFDNPVTQRCQIHKERNIRGCLSKRHHSELTRLFKRLRKAEGAEAGPRSALGHRGFFIPKKPERSGKPARGGRGLDRPAGAWVSRGTPRRSSEHERHRELDQQHQEENSSVSFLRSSAISFSKASKNLPPGSTGESVLSDIKW